MDELKIFSGRANQKLAEQICREAGVPLGHTEIQNFSDGEIWVKFTDNIRGADVFIVQPTQPPSDNLMELLIMLDAAKRASSRRVTAVIPYFGYARQDRKDQPRVAITAKLAANVLTTAGADRIIAMDLHAPQIQGFFDVPLDHLYSSAVFVEYFRSLEIPNLAVASPDVGGIKMARSYAKRLETDLILIDKRRPKANEVEIMNVIGNVEGKNVLVVDDLIDTAGTFVNAVQALKESGAKEVYGACTHPILSGKSFERIESSDVKEIIVTDSIPMRRQSKKIKVLTAAHIFAEAIVRTHKHESISSLFDVDKDRS
ncbi:MAG: ribose-phosphate pyrophosphokinase [Ignavibacteriales bacterium]|nr:ribose-phosphate pyrophosphokinase [Ignavibacteriales bacterium]